MSSNPQQPRIVSLIASATEIVCALGLRDCLVGRSHECDYPSDVLALPQCTSPKFQLDGSSYEIDQRVKAVLQESLSVYKVDAELVDSLAPTHIITQSQCEVCAVSLKDVQDAACRFIHSQPRIVSLQPNSLTDVWDDIATVGGALGIPERAQRLVSDLQRRLQEIQSRRRDKPRPRLVFVEWIEPLMVGGNWMPTLIGIAGGVNLFGEEGKHSPPLTWESLRQADPDVIVVAPCGFDMERTRQDMYFLQDKPHWSELNAVQSGRVYVADGNQFFNRPGPRLVESTEILESIFDGQAAGQGFAKLG
ncbi:MAG TPA: cobalamin-binding protein [Candidatus Obscuribacterales bacterium]